MPFDTTIPPLGSYSSTSGTSSSSSSKSSYDGSTSVWTAFAANAGDTLTGAANLWAAISGKAVQAPVTNNYLNNPNSTGGNNMLIYGGIGLGLLFIILLIAFKSKI